ncbi:MAG: hypothetical protein M1358_20530 [Chloroflexi bacterium]|nr:hypothetical protein [Chloroflexota bacterium]
MSILHGRTNPVSPEKDLATPIPPTSDGPRTEQSPLTAIKKRAAQPLLVAMFAVESLLSSLPLVFPVDNKLLAPIRSHKAIVSEPASPKARYRSHYRYLGSAALLDGARLAKLSDFEIAIYLIDFSPLEPVLVRIYKVSNKGQLPFHPVSMFLCICLRRELKLGWRKLAKLLAGDHGAGWRTLFGFDEGNTPSASGLRYFFNTVGPQVFDELCPCFMDLLRQHGLCPERSTYPGDPPERGVTMSHDGMLHQSLSRPSCQLTTNDCYQPVAEPRDISNQVSSGVEHPQDVAESDASDTSAQPFPQSQTERGKGQDATPIETPSANSAPIPGASPSLDCKRSEEGTSNPTDKPPTAQGRPCNARDKGLPGCSCNTPECQERCKRASTLDPKARFIHYEGHNNKHQKAEAEPSKEDKAKGTDVFGYRSTAQRELDDRFSVAWTAKSSFYSANVDERKIFPKEVQEVRDRFPTLSIGEYLGDSGIGYEESLNAIWNLGALRMVDIRADAGDKDLEKCILRGYNGNGHPLCPHGYELHSNGYDYNSRRRKYVCRQACRKEPRTEGEEVCAVEGCPYLDEGSLGFTINVGRTLPGGCVRLAREIPYGSEEWDQRYGRRNLSENRNSQLEGMGLKRMKSYGTERNTKEVQVADFMVNLHTLGRLVREASNFQTM